MLTVYQVVMKISELALFLEKLEKDFKEQKNKVLLIRSLRSLLAYSAIVLKNFTTSEKINYKIPLDYSKYKGKAINIEIGKEFVDIILRKTLMTMAWSFFEYFFQAETNTNKFGKKLLVKYFDEENKIPLVINYFRGVRNSIHSNGTYYGEELSCEISGNNYEIKDGQEVFYYYPFIFSIIKESLNSLER